MNGLSVKKLAHNIDIPLDRLISTLKEIDINIESEDDVISGMQQLELLQYLRTRESVSNIKKDFTINDVIAAKELGELNQLLTKAMAERKIQGLIKEDNLDVVIESILALTVDADQELLSAVSLGRLAAVIRKDDIKLKVFNRVNEVFTEEPVSLETLDGEDKQYVAQMLSHASFDWISEYSYREALAIETAEIPRVELLTACLAREGSIANWITAITGHVAVINSMNNFNVRLTRVRRIFESMKEVAENWRGDVGSDFGDLLANCLDTFLARKIQDVDQKDLFLALDWVFSILVRVIELRFSNALYANTYAALEQGKKIVGSGVWGHYIGQSSVINKIRIALLESALVLARQNRSDKQIMAVLASVYTSKPQTALAIKRHFENVQDLDPDTGNWWRNAGEVSETQRHVEHKVGNTEDSQIGALLIEVESNREAMDKVGRVVVQYLEISDPVLASTVKKAVDGYQGIAQTAHRLARMRKLTKTDWKGERLEYNPLVHEMLGGHKSGVRRVKVVRDGIRKEFGGKIKTLVKAWVEPEE
jgi:hypothetical protein